MKKRCSWVGDDPKMLEYHDNEWGVPVHDDRLLFEFLILEGAQAGLSWNTILQKRENYRIAFDNFDITKVANYSDERIKDILTNPRIVRNRLKVNSAVQNAKAVLKIQKEFKSFDNYIWEFIGGNTLQNHWNELKEIPSSTLESEKMSKDLKKIGFNFVGPKICYSFMQAVGMVNDHTVDCFRYDELNND